MPATTNKPLTAKHDLFVTNLFKQSMNAGKAYSDTYPDCSSGQDQSACALLRNPKIQSEVARRQAEISGNVAEELKWEHEDNLRAQYVQIAYYRAILAKHPDNLQALQGLNQVLRELNASNGQHSQTIFTEEALPPPLTEVERTALLAMTAHLRHVASTVVDEQPQPALGSAETEIMEDGGSEKALPPKGRGP